MFRYQCVFRASQIALVLPCVLACAVTVRAQDRRDEDPFSEAPIRVGIFALAPTVSLRNLGVDTNVFNELENPKRDFTFTVSPQMSLWMRTQRGLLTLTGRSDVVYYNTYRSERAVNGFGTIKYEYRFNRLTPFIEFSGLDSKERVGFEVDVRARRFENEIRPGVELRVASKSVLEMSARRKTLSYADDALVGEQPLRQSLNRTLETVDLRWRQRLTALTTWIVSASGERERFEFETARNGDSARVSSGFELSRFALIRGSAFVGYRRLVGAAAGTLLPFSGVTSDVDVSYTAPTQTRLSAAVFRDLQYSYDIRTPYYVQTGWAATLRQRIVGKWDLQLRGGRDRLLYESSADVDANRRDRVDHIGGGIGYQLNNEIRASFDVQSDQRQSALAERDFKTLRSGLSVNYVF